MYAINPFNMYVRLLKYHMVNAKHNLFLSEYKKYRRLEIVNTDVRQDLAPINLQYVHIARSRTGSCRQSKIYQVIQV